jgi:hypothetical protein
MSIRFSFSKAFDWYIITIYKLYFVILFGQNISKIIYFLHQEISENMHFLNKTPFFSKRKIWQLGKYLIYIQQIELYRMYGSNFPHIHFYFFRFFSSNGTIRAQFTHIHVCMCVEKKGERKNEFTWFLLENLF